MSELAEEECTELRRFNFTHQELVTGDGDLGELLGDLLDTINTLRAERDELREALSGRTVSCAGCNAAAEHGGDDV